MQKPGKRLGKESGKNGISAAEGAEGVPESVCRNKQTGITR